MLYKDDYTDEKDKSSSSDSSNVSLPGTSKDLDSVEPLTAKEEEVVEEKDKVDEKVQVVEVDEDQDDSDQKIMMEKLADLNVSK